MSSHPKSVETPDGVELDEFGDKENEDGVVEYVRFTATFEAGDKVVNEFLDRLKSDFEAWEVASGGGVDEVVISMRREYAGPVSPPEDSDAMQEYREREGEYYRKQFEQSQS